MSTHAVSSAVHHPERLAALRRLRLPDARSRVAFDRLSGLAARLLQAPVAAVSLVEEDRQIFHGSYGLTGPLASMTEIPPDVTFCRYVVEQGVPIVAGDTRLHPVLRDHPGLAESGAAAYLGIPLTTAGGHVLGSFSVVDTERRDWTAHDVAVMQDLAASVLTELELRRELMDRVESEARNQRVLEAISDGFVVLDTEWRIRYLNRAAEVGLRCDRNALLGACVWDHFPSVAGSLFEREYRRAVAEGVPVAFEGHFAPLDVWLSVHAYPSEEGLSVFFRDITEARARDARQRMLAAALDGVQEGVCLLTTGGQIVYANATFAAIVGTDAERLPGTSLLEMGGDPQAQAERRENLLQAMEQGRWSGRIRRRRLDDGREVVLDAVLGRVDGSGADAPMLFGMVQDATGQMEREAQLRRLERLSSIATLVGGVAHELNNPLSAMLNFAQLLALDEHDPARREDLHAIGREGERMAKIIADLKQIARGTEEAKPQKSPVDLNEVVRHVLKVQDYRLRTSGVEVEADLADGLPLVLADRGQMEQVVLNLVVNALQAVVAHAARGRLVVRTRASARGVALHVVDDGPGIPAHLLERIFDPFFTTKAPGEGTGLGLSLVHSIVTEHAGEIHVESRLGAGSAFRVDLPRARQSPAPPAPPEAPAAAGRPLRVLVVDDEASIRHVLSRYLGRRGHRVSVAGDGNAALERIEREDFDVVLSDLRMPGLGGEALLERLGERGLSRRVVFMTGDAAGGRDRIGTPEVPLLLKPVSLLEVAAAVEEVGRRREAPAGPEAADGHAPCRAGRHGRPAPVAA